MAGDGLSVLVVRLGMRRLSLRSVRLVVPEHPVNLAALRIAVTSILLLSPETYAAEQIAALPSALRFPPEGLAWAGGVIPISSGMARSAQVALIVSAGAGLIGLWSRLSLGVATLSGLYVFGLFQLTGSVTHDMHLLWFSALCAAGPCGEALSVDRLLAKRRGEPAPEPSLRAGVPLFFARALLGLVYFFPGFWKLRESGIAWITSDNLKNQMHWKWLENGAMPLFRIDRSDALLHAGALGVVALELSFPLLVLLPRTRLAAAVAGLAFHVSTQLFLFIPFPSLWACYTLLVDWSRVRLPWRAPREASPERSDSTWPLGAAALGTALLGLTTLQGVRNRIQAWPFACYPTFQWRAGSTLPDMVIEAVRTDGSTHVLPDGHGGGRVRTPAEWATAWRVAGVYGEPPTETRLRSYLEQARRRSEVDVAVGDATLLRFYRAWYSVRPEEWARPPVRAERIGEIRLR